MARVFQLVGGHLALDFANTLDFRYVPEQRIELLSSYEELLKFCRESGIITAHQARKLLTSTSKSSARRAFKRAIELRETLYFLFSSVAGGHRAKRGHLRAFNRFLEHARVADRVVWRERKLIRAHRNPAETPDGPLWPVIDAAASLLTSSDCRYVCECGDNTCRWLFLDRSKNHSRRWCDMRVCGNRSKARRFYARLRARA